MLTLVEVVLPNDVASVVMEILHLNVHKIIVEDENYFNGVDVIVVKIITDVLVDIVAVLISTVVLNRAITGDIIKIL